MLDVEEGDVDDDDDDDPDSFLPDQNQDFSFDVHH